MSNSPQPISPSAPATIARTTDNGLLRLQIHELAAGLSGDSLVALHAVALALCGVPIVLPKREVSEVEVRAKARMLSHRGLVCPFCGFKSVNTHGLYRHQRRLHRQALIERILKGE